MDSILFSRAEVGMMFTELLPRNGYQRYNMAYSDIRDNER
jgi:hypothetical protein